MPAWLVSWLFESIGGWLLGKGADAVVKEVEEKPEPVPVLPEGKKNDPPPK